jgi:hypothetical protein
MRAFVHQAAHKEERLNARLLLVFHSPDRELAKANDFAQFARIRDNCSLRDPRVFKKLRKKSNFREKFLWLDENFCVITNFFIKITNYYLWNSLPERFWSLSCCLTKPFTTFSQFFMEITSFRHNSVPEIPERHAAGWGEETVPQKQVVILQQPVHLKLRAPHQVPDLGWGEGE